MEVEECRKFIIRSEKRISEFDAERAAEGGGALDEARARLSRLEAEQAAVPKVVSEPVPEVVPPPEWAAEVQRLREELERLRAGRSPVPVGHWWAILSEVPPRLPIFCRRGPPNGVQELQRQFPTIHKTWKGGCHRNTQNSATRSSSVTRSQFWR